MYEPDEPMQGGIPSAVYSGSTLWLSEEYIGRIKYP